MHTILVQLCTSCEWVLSPVFVLMPSLIVILPLFNRLQTILHVYSHVHESVKGDTKSSHSILDSNPTSHYHAANNSAAKYSCIKNPHKRGSTEILLIWSTYKYCLWLILNPSTFDYLLFI